MFPGSPNLIVLSILPLGHERTSFSGYQYALDIDQDDDMRQQYQVDVLSPPDVVLCESVQKGLRSQSYDQGRFVVDPDLSGIADTCSSPVPSIGAECAGINQLTERFSLN